MLDQFKDLFGRFQNLNLINLKIDLERREVPMGVWYFQGYNGFDFTTFICPMAHGIDCSVKIKEDERVIRESNWARRGWPVNDVYDFLHWWDGRSYLGGTKDERREKLTQLINSMWQERVDDADSVQEILEQEPLVEELPCSLSQLLMTSVKN